LSPGAAGSWGGGVGTEQPRRSAQGAELSPSCLLFCWVKYGGSWVSYYCGLSQPMACTIHAGLRGSVVGRPKVAHLHPEVRKEVGLGAGSLILSPDAFLFTVFWSFFGGGGVVASLHLLARV
jgi:hypothetical protein